MNIRERPKIYYSMRTIPIELAYALCLVSSWMHNRSVTRAGATSSYKLVAETVLVVAILRALNLVIGNTVLPPRTCTLRYSLTISVTVKLALGACCVALGAD